MVEAVHSERPRYLTLPELWFGVNETVMGFLGEDDRT